MPIVAASVATTARPAQRAGPGRRAATRSSVGPQVSSPTTAPNDSWNDAPPTAAGSCTTTSIATAPSRDRIDSARPVARPTATSVTSPAARCAETGAPTARQNAQAVATATTAATGRCSPRGRHHAVRRRGTSTTPATRAATRPTWNPLIASRCAVPVRRRRAVASGATSRRSPVARARRSPPSRGGGGSPPILTTRVTSTCVRTRPRRASRTGSGAPGGPPSSTTRPTPTTRTRSPTPATTSAGTRRRTRPRSARHTPPTGADDVAAAVHVRPERPTTTTSATTGPRQRGPSGSVATDSRPIPRPATAAHPARHGPRSTPAIPTSTTAKAVDAHAVVHPPSAAPTTAPIPAVQARVTTTSGPPRGPDPCRGIRREGPSAGVEVSADRPTPSSPETP